MGWNNHLDIDEQEFTEFLQQLLDMKHLENPAQGITHKVIADGVDDLSRKQRFVFERDVMGVYVTEECSICGNPIPWSEMYEAWNNGGICAQHTHIIALN